MNVDKSDRRLLIIYSLSDWRKVSFNHVWIVIIGITSNFWMILMHCITISFAFLPFTSSFITRRKIIRRKNIFLSFSILSSVVSSRFLLLFPFWIYTLFVMLRISWVWKKKYFIYGVSPRIAEFIMNYDQYLQVFLWLCKNTSEQQFFLGCLHWSVVL